MDVTWLKLKGFVHMCVIGCGDGGVFEVVLE